MYRPATTGFQTAWISLDDIVDEWPTMPQTGSAWDPSAKDPDGSYHLSWIEDTKLSVFTSSLKFQVEADGVLLTVIVSERSSRVVVYKRKKKLDSASLSPVHPTHCHKKLWCIIKGHFKGCLCQSVKFEIVANNHDTQTIMWLVHFVELNIDGSFVLMDTCIEVPSSNLIVMDIIDRRQKELYQQDIVQKSLRSKLRDLTPVLFLWGQILGWILIWFWLANQVQQIWPETQQYFYMYLVILDPKLTLNTCKNIAEFQARFAALDLQAKTRSKSTQVFDLTKILIHRSSEILANLMLLGLHPHMVKAMQRTWVVNQCWRAVKPVILIRSNLDGHSATAADSSYVHFRHSDG
ncbi:hypothetical protein ARMSODRAFT_977835 [Armillaria solidipes]|uniref:Uncharacterized protein n=1 Tax=Armillaria solidipes TaxID=1076256 RepID=A0A2H3BBB1_9AGAR|nr:hypothetical protein ARMSODRAFT_977835 [Armillaria solidipes]